MPGNSDYKLTDLDVITTIGTGSFSKVSLIQHKPSSKIFALKVLPIDHIVKMKQTDHVKNEKKVLQEVNHPFLLSLTSTFKDCRNLYMLFPYICGGELFTYLRMAGSFPLATSLFYSTEIVSALSYLHSLHIVYRDLKPENILIGKDGHIVITDFGFSKKVNDKTWTLCGTPEYLAPEILQSRGHSKSVDWWALGVLMYEMLAGYPPFLAEDPLAIYEKILAAKINWPQGFDLLAKDLIQRLLEVDITKRLGCGKLSAEEVKSHKFFLSIDWDSVEDKKLTPPIVPCVTSETDTRNFIVFDNGSDFETEPVTDDDIKLFDDF